MPEIIHIPLGQEHPYQQLPEERFPRHPHAGEPFTVGVVTRPAGAVKSITLRASLENDTPLPVPAEQIVDWQPLFEQVVGSTHLNLVNDVDQDVWQAKLTAPSAGQTLTYWLESEQSQQTGKFTLRGEDWQLGGGILLADEGIHIAQHHTQTTLPDGAPSLERIEWLTDGNHARRVRLTFHAATDEHFFGLGERFNAVDQRGNIMDIRVYEKYRDQGVFAYMPIPFLLSSSGYGLWVDSARWMQFDLAATSPDCWTLEADLGADETLRLVLFNEGDPLANIAAFARLTGPVALPPEWAFGLWMSSNEWNSQARVMKEAQASFEHQITPSVLVIEAWSDESTFYIWNDAQYQPRSGDQSFTYDDFTFPPQGKWPNPKAMTDWLHDHDVKLILWQIPALKKLEPHPQQDADRAYFESAQFGVRNADGSAYTIRPGWFRGGYLWDPTNTAEHDWWLSKRQYLLDEMGIDGFKTDGGEHLWGTNVVFADGRTGDENWNRYPQLYTEAYYRFANQYRKALTFSRAGFTGSQRSPAHWAGDERSTWEAYRHSINAGLSAATSGISFWGWDIGGFSGEIPTAELYLRTTAMAAFCPIFQYHSEFNHHREPHVDRTPWNIQARTGDDRVIPTFRHFNNVRLNLMPYIWQEAQHSAATGEPMMRALKLYDPSASDYAYSFGRDLLVFPVVEPDVNTLRIRLPAGRWYSLWDSNRYEGGAEIEIEAPLNSIPVFVRAGASIPVNLPASGKLGDAVPFSTKATRTLEFL